MEFFRQTSIFVIWITYTLIEKNKKKYPRNTFKNSPIFWNLLKLFMTFILSIANRTKENEKQIVNIKEQYWVKRSGTISVVHSIWSREETRCFQISVTSWPSILGLYIFSIKMINNSLLCKKLWQLCLVERIHPVSLFFSWLLKNCL